MQRNIALLLRLRQLIPSITQARLNLQEVTLGDIPRIVTLCNNIAQRLYDSDILRNSLVVALGTR